MDIEEYYKEFDSESFLKEVQNSIDPSIENLSKEFQFVFYKILHIDPCSYWNEIVYRETYSLLKDLYDDKLEINESILNYYLMGYNSYCELAEIIVDLKNFNLTNEIKTRLYRLPTYSTLLESCLSNLLRIIAILKGNKIGKDYSKQNTLGQLINVIKLSGYNEISKNVDVNIRNAINHGKVLMKKNPSDKICFFYNENHISKSKEVSIYEFDKIIDDTFDTISAVLLSISVFMNNYLSSIKIDYSKKEYVPFSFLAMRISLPGINCYNISDTGNLKQLNVEIEIENTNSCYLLEISTLISIMVYDKYNDYEQYMINFSNPRMMNGWVRYKNQEIVDIINNFNLFGDIFNNIIQRGDFVFSPPSTEDVDLSEIKYFCFPNYNTKSFKINNVKDASIEERKRIKASLYIDNIDDRNKILAIINQSIDWLKTVKNPPSSIIKHKYGDVPADSIYINVYRKDGREHKELYLNNENFICFVDYNIDGVTTLENGGLPDNLWKSYHHEKVDNTFIAWREGKYCTRQIIKVGRNELCPCGSGKKYKKCCGK